MSDTDGAEFIVLYIFGDITLSFYSMIILKDMFEIVSLFKKIRYCNLCDFALLLQNEQSLSAQLKHNSNDNLNLTDIQRCINICKLLNAELELKQATFNFFGVEITKGKIYTLIISWGVVKVGSSFLL